MKRPRGDWVEEKRGNGVPGVLEDAENQANNRDYELENGSLESGVGGGDGQAVQEIGHYDLEGEEVSSRNEPSCPSPCRIK